MANNNRSSKSNNSSHHKPNNWLNRHGYVDTPIKKDWGKRHENFQVDATMSIRQMVQRYNSGQSIPVTNVEYFDQEMPHPGSDLTDKMDFLKYNDQIVRSEIQNKTSNIVSNDISHSDGANLPNEEKVAQNENKDVN